MKAIHIGIIAEDDSDITVLKTLAKKLTSRSFSTSHFVGKGCGPIKRKTLAWCKVFAKKGCVAVVLVHDLDRNDHKKLRRELEDILAGAEQKIKAVIIPTEELEAWLLADPAALKRSMNLIKEPKKTKPETIKSPKEHLGGVIRSHSKGQAKQYVNAVHNPIIAKEMSVEKIHNSCPSFHPFERFVSDAFGA